MQLWPAVRLRRRPLPRRLLALSLCRVSPARSGCLGTAACRVAAQHRSGVRPVAAGPGCVPVWPRGPGTSSPSALVAHHGSAFPLRTLSITLSFPAAKCNSLEISRLRRGVFRWHTDLRRAGQESPQLTVVDDSVHIVQTMFAPCSRFPPLQRWSTCPNTFARLLRRLGALRPLRPPSSCRCPRWSDQLRRSRPMAGGSPSRASLTCSAVGPTRHGAMPSRLYRPFLPTTSRCARARPDALLPTKPRPVPPRSCAVGA